MTEVVFSPEARRDLTETADYIADKLQNKAAARNFLKRTRETVRILTRFPESGAPLSISGTAVMYRCLKCGNYMIFYHLSDERAYIDRILYGRRDFMAILFGAESETAEQ